MSPGIFSSCPKLQGCVSLADVAEERPVLLPAPLDDKWHAPPAGVCGGGHLALVSPLHGLAPFKASILLLLRCCFLLEVPFSPLLTPRYGSPREGRKGECLK